MTTSYRLAADFFDAREIMRYSSQPKLHVTMPGPALRFVCVFQGKSAHMLTTLCYRRLLNLVCLIYQHGFRYDLNAVGNVFIERIKYLSTLVHS